LAARVQARHDQLQRAHLFRRVDVHRNAAPVVLDPNNVVPLENHRDLRAEALHGLVHGVVHDLEHHVVKAVDAGRPYVHPGPFANGLKSLEYCYVLR